MLVFVASASGLALGLFGGYWLGRWRGYGAGSRAGFVAALRQAIVLENLAPSRHSIHSMSLR